MITITSAVPDQRPFPAGSTQVFVCRLCPLCLRKRHWDYSGRRRSIAWSVMSFQNFASSCSRAGNCHSACLQARRRLPHGSDKRSSRSEPDMAKPRPTARFFDFEKQKTDPPPDFKIFRNRNAHPYRLGAKSTPGTGDFDDMGRGDDHLWALSGWGQLCLLFVCVRSAPHFFESRRA